MPPPPQIKPLPSRLSTLSNTNQETSNNSSRLATYSSNNNHVDNVLPSTESGASNGAVSSTSLLADYSSEEQGASISLLSKLAHKEKSQTQKKTSGGTKSLLDIAKENNNEEFDEIDSYEMENSEKEKNRVIATLQSLATELNEKINTKTYNDVMEEDAVEEKKQHPGNAIEKEKQGKKKAATLEKTPIKSKKMTSSKESTESKTCDLQEKDDMTNNCNKRRKELFSSVYHGHFERVCDILEDSDDDLDATDAHGWTPLHYACSQKHLKIVNFLINKGADLNTQEKTNGWTPLHIAAVQECKAVVETLVNGGSNPTLRDHHGDRPIDCIGFMKKNERMSFKVILERKKEQDESDFSSDFED